MRSAQRGATLIIGLIMIVLITLIVVNAFTLSSSNMKSVGNMQARDESLAAANEALELVTSSAFTDSPVAQAINVDLNKDGTTDYSVDIAQPVCARATASTTGGPSDVELGAALTSSAKWNTEWDLQATVSDALTGAKVIVRQGVRVLLTDTQKTAVCP
ncbi:hypothetical protein I5803_05730 [Caenimonas sp. DR4.4]|uniref:Type 4 fimbrial biogenesis protein PilX N-terminal domain-containing protein n=2 Tax=Caenimonas aquaedulcis TaxID=2793270 RepID=A0A931H2U7_9BURK|nr:hypothetical protein [Caenimonas aquaedulcis]